MVLHGRTFGIAYALWAEEGSAFVYYRDPTRQTDRLIATRTGSTGF